MHEEGAELPSMATNDDNIELACGIGLFDRRVINDEVAHCLQISHCSVYEIIHNRVRLHKMYEKWVPKLLTVLHKQTSMDIWHNHLDCYVNEHDSFLDRITTGDKT